MARSTLLIFNPAAGQRWGAKGLPERIVERLTGRGIAAELAPTDGPGDATRIARHAAADGYDTVFALGGDGTFREAAEGLLGSATALGTLPAGTINLVPWSLGIPAHPESAAEALAAGRPTEIDVGLCDERAFLILVSFGLDGRVMARVPRGLKRHLGRVAVAGRGVVDWLTYDYPRVTVRADGREIEGSFAAISNLPHYGGSTVLAPRASPTSGRLELLVFRGVGRTATLAFAVDLALGRHVDRRDVETLSVDEIEIEGPAGLPLEIDGEGLESSPPHRIRLAPHRLRILVP